MGVNITRYRRATLAAAAAAVTAALFAVAPARPARAATVLLPAIPFGTISVSLGPAARGLVAPVDVRSIPDGSGRLVVTDQAGKIQIIQNGNVVGTIADL